MLLYDYWLTVAVVIGNFGCSVTKSDGTVYVENYCDKKIKIKEAQSIALSEDVFYPSGWRCQTTLEAPHNHVIWFNFHYFDVGRPSVIYCTDVLRIYDGESTQSPELSPSKGLCGRFIPRPLATTSNLATFKFKSMVVTTSTGFKLTATVQRNAENNICSNEEFRCLDGFCIDKKLKCNQEINCRDNSDESALNAGCEGLLAKWTDMNNFARVGIIVGIFIGISFIIFLVMSLCFFCFSRKKYKRLQD
uniref:Low-density lipoprotein receptor-related protein 12-like n=1 Tax=Crassostrea virginica TaxID=6565 RepID=A0A8B8EX54_CRAVI|nr:low-density lipoprotein receptor-related protein 12-like [Crassostrea virginica]